MSAPIYLPAQMVLTAHALPAVCPRHVRPAVTHRKVTFTSRPPLWIYLLLVAGILPLLIALVVTRKTLVAPSWSFCDECLARRRSLLIAIGVTVAVMVASLLAPVEVVPVLCWLIGIVVLVVLGAQRGWVALAAADVTRDSLALIVRKPGPDFVRYLPAHPSAAPAPATPTGINR